MTAGLLVIKMFSLGNDVKKIRILEVLEGLPLQTHSDKKKHML